MFKIGEFSRLTRVSLKTLHHYDEIGLFKPAHVDRFTDYRYYTFAQLPRLNRILALKGLGFSLEQIRQIVDGGLNTDELRGMLRLRRAELEQQAAEAQERLQQVEIRLRQIEQEGNVPQIDILTKTIGPVMVAGARETVPSIHQMRERCIALDAEACTLMRNNKLRSDGVSFALYYNTEDSIDVEMAYVVQPTAKPVRQGKAEVHQLAAVTVAYTVYTGSYDDFAGVVQHHAALNQWITANGYRRSGPSREFYLRPPRRFSDPDGVMEIQYPMEKVVAE
jgi:DNA-binding transcriptional MerR regulator